jgi:hypothetical protein
MFTVLLLIGWPFSMLKMPNFSAWLLECCFAPACSCLPGWSIWQLANSPTICVVLNSAGFAIARFASGGGR